MSSHRLSYQKPPGGFAKFDPNFIDYKELLFSLIASLTIADHLGDAANAVRAVIDKAGKELPDIEELESDETYFDYLRRRLSKAGYRTLLGTEVWDEDND